MLAGQRKTWEVEEDPWLMLIDDCLVFSIDCRVFPVDCLIFSIDCLVFSIDCFVFSIDFFDFSIDCFVFSIDSLVSSVDCLVFPIDSLESGQPSVLAVGLWRKFECLLTLLNQMYRTSVSSICREKKLSINTFKMRPTTVLIEKERSVASRSWQCWVWIK